MFTSKANNNNKCDETKIVEIKRPICCPLCSKSFPGDISNAELNIHIDLCLTKEKLPETMPTAASVSKRKRPFLSASPTVTKYFKVKR